MQREDTRKRWRCARSVGCERAYRAFDKALRRSWPTRAVFRNMSGILTFKGLCKILHPARCESKQDRHRIAKVRRAGFQRRRP
jgi:hypothetical protein